jgi:putative addiction module antidote
LFTVSIGGDSWFAASGKAHYYNVCYNATEPPMTALKLTQIGNSVGVILPKEVLARLKLEKGDTVFVTDAVNGVLLTPYSPQFEDQMAKARQIMKKRRNVLRELAK